MHVRLQASGEGGVPPEVDCNGCVLTVHLMPPAFRDEQGITSLSAIVQQVSRCSAELFAQGQKHLMDFYLQCELLLGQHRLLIQGVLLIVGMSKVDMAVVGRLSKH